jgi:purine-binding chemotaxis protein CheW
MRLGDRVFAVDIMGVGEILRKQPITDVPNAPKGLAGVINVRGQLMSVLNLKSVLGLPTSEERSAKDRVVLVRHGGEMFGLLVDSVLDVAQIGIEEVNPVPSGDDISDSTIIGMFNREIEEVVQVVMILRLGTLAVKARGDSVEA